MIRLFIFHGSPSIQAKLELLEFIEDVKGSADQVRAALIDKESALSYENILSLIPNEEDIVVQPMLIFNGKHHNELVAYLKEYQKHRVGKVFLTPTLHILGKLLIQDPLCEVQNAPWSPEVLSTKPVHS